MPGRAATLAPRVQAFAFMPDALTDQKYWDSVWSFTEDHLREAPIVRADRDAHHAWLDGCFRARLGAGKRFLEVGAGGSAWPAWVARRGAEAWGIDFSRAGLSIAAACAARDGVRARLVAGDLFDRALLPLGAFDVVYSGGFVEHFPDARPLMERLAELVAPGGVVVTAVPNLAGLNGALQRLVDESCFQRHVVFTPRTLDAAHALGGLRPVARADFLGLFDLGSVNFARVADRLPAPALKLIWAGLSQSRRAGEVMGRAVGAVHGGWLFAPGIAGVYTR
jgi:2-polyprenyl-3-methyl-5-hydroxy-6-metoxy-1,4-benzoquinol methylase